MIIYIHGFASSGFGSKAEKFKEYFEDEIGGYCDPISDWEEYAESFILP